jgi:hypothetical protein
MTGPVSGHLKKGRKTVTGPDLKALIALGQMEGSGPGKGQEKGLVIGL